MATLIGNLFSSSFLPSQLGSLRPHKFKLKPCTPPILKCSFAATNVRASSSTSLVDTTPTFELAKDFLKPVYGGSIIDASCGSGLFLDFSQEADCFLSLLLWTTQKTCCSSAMNSFNRRII
ncbi:hypothetical protein Pyn_20581 [Prunus yedoensis var. nudiflora]|uniref:Uncharacterized protein n=1 Tax=Prunus yedoensis var. nudiflora TaxID=2094558 RepID=A0A314UVI2_PRUYE|nr:hypothetical protein Pyn_20581 [Prunus yedoensis var. nudiflora]